MGLVVSWYEYAISSGTDDARRPRYILFRYKEFKLGQLSSKMREGCETIHHKRWPEYYTKSYGTLHNESIQTTNDTTTIKHCWQKQGSDLEHIYLYNYNHIANENKIAYLCDKQNTDIMAARTNPYKKRADHLRGVRHFRHHCRMFAKCDNRSLSPADGNN